LDSNKWRYLRHECQVHLRQTNTSTQPDFLVRPDVHCRQPIQTVYLLSHAPNVSLMNVRRFLRYDTIEEFNMDSKAEYSVLSSTHSQKKTKT